MAKHRGDARIEHSLGDLGMVYEDADGASAEVWEQVDDAGVTYVYRFPIPVVTDAVGEWFGDDLNSVAITNGLSVSKLKAALASPDPRKRFWAYHDIASYHGFENFDSDPLVLSNLEFEKRQQKTERKRRYEQFGVYNERPGRHRVAPCVLHEDCRDNPRDIGAGCAREQRRHR